MKNQIKHKIPKYQQTVLQCLNTTLIIQIVMVIRRGRNLLHMLAMSSEEHTHISIFNKVPKKFKRATMKQRRQMHDNH